MLKKVCISLVLPLLALSVCTAYAADNGADPLTLDDLTAFSDSVRSLAAADEPLNDPHDTEALTEDGYLFVYDFGMLYFDRPELTEDAVLNTFVYFGEEAIAPHATAVNMSAQELLASYYTENSQLDGSAENAVLYLYNDLPSDGSAGLVSRDGQRIQSVQYSIYEQLATGGEGYVNAGIIYTIENDEVSSIRVYGLNGRAAMEDVESEMEILTRLSDESGYTAVPSSAVGTELTVFSWQDLSFSGIELLTLTPDQAVTVFGDPLEDLWSEDGKNWLRSMEFESCELVFQYNSKKQDPQLLMLYVTKDGLEGPRGVRVGDTLSSVIRRFRFETDDLTGDVTLYGTVGEGSYAEAGFYDDASAILNYVADCGTATVTLTVSSEALSVTMYQLYIER